VIAWITIPQDAASAARQPERGAEPTIASAAATLSSRLAAEDTALTGPETALMQQWLTTLADAPSAAPPAPPRRSQRSGKENSQ
jgi:glutathione S-transferase